MELLDPSPSLGPHQGPSLPHGKEPQAQPPCLLTICGRLGHQSAPDSKCEFRLSPPSSHGRQGSLLYGGGGKAQDQPEKWKQGLPQLPTTPSPKQTSACTEGA